MKRFNQLLGSLLFLCLLVSVAHATLNDDDYVTFNDALVNGDIAVVDKFMQQGKAAVNDIYLGWSALQIATNHNQLPMVKYLVEHGANLNYAHPITKLTAFHFAAYQNNEAILRYLAQKGADVNLKLRGGVSILRAMQDSHNQHMIDVLTSLGVKDDGCQDTCL